MIRAEPTRLLFLDSARGLAALSVITWHCYTAIINHTESSKLGTSPFHFFMYGEADVIFFFIHSGFILSYSYTIFQTKFSRVDYFIYLIRRIFRIYPLFLFILFFSYLLKITIFPIHSDNYLSVHFQNFWGNKISLKDVLNQSLLAIRIPENANQRLIPQDWTLTIEVLICPLIPLINFFNKKYKIFVLIFMLFLLKIIHFNTFLFEFAVGVYLYTFRNQISFVWNKSHFFLKSMAFLLGIIFYTCNFGFPNIFNKGGSVYSPAIDRLMVVGGCAIFFIFILNSVFIQKLLQYPYLIKIGKLCYSLYAIHILLLICFSSIVMTTIHHFLTGPQWLITLFFVLFFQLFTISFSLITYKFIEKPFNKLGKRIGIIISDRLVHKLQS